MRRSLAGSILLATIFSDGFETGNTSRWSVTVPAPASIWDNCAVVTRPYEWPPPIPAWACDNLPRCTETRWVRDGDVILTTKTMPRGRWKDEVCR